MTTGFHQLVLGDVVELKGPLGSFIWTGPGVANWKGSERKVKEVGMICGGSGTSIRRRTSHPGQSAPDMRYSTLQPQSPYTSDFPPGMSGSSATVHDGTNLRFQIPPFLNDGFSVAPGGGAEVIHPVSGLPMLPSFNISGQEASGTTVPHLSSWAPNTADNNLGPSGKPYYHKQVYVSCSP